MSTQKKVKSEVIKNDPKTGLVVNGRYKLDQLIGSGSFGELRYGLDLNTKNPIAIKLEAIKDNVKVCQLEQEFKFYKMLGTADGIPEVFYYGQCGQYNALVMELLGRNLEDIFYSCGQQFSLKTIIYIFLQLLQRIEHIHNCHLVYRDIKPENFVLGRKGLPKRKSNIIHVIDFGLAKQYFDPKTKAHIPMREGKRLTGTARYMSVNSHLGKEQSRRDDLESIGYMIMYFLRQGRLPWSGLKAKTDTERYRKIGDFKRGTPIETLCYGFPPAFAEYLRCVRMLDFEERPNYRYLKTLFIKLFQKEHLEDDGRYDWD